MADGAGGGQPAFKAWAEAGFAKELIPIQPADAPVSSEEEKKKLGKVPTIPKWSTVVVTPEQIQQWSGEHLNAGIRTAFFPTIDVDVDDAKMVAAIEEVIGTVIGPTAVRRRDNSPRSAFICRLEGAPFKKKILGFRLPDGTKAKVEILAEGQQVVVAGFHISGAELICNPKQPLAHDLAPMSVTTRDDLIAALRTRLEELGCTFTTVEERMKAEKPLAIPKFNLSGVPWQHRQKEAVDQDDAHRALNALNPDMDYEGWIRVGMALHSRWPEEQGPGFFLWDNWSRQGSSYPSKHDTSTLEHWRSFTAGDITFSTLFGMEKQVGSNVVPLPVGKAPSSPAGASAGGGSGSPPEKEDFKAAIAAAAAKDFPAQWTQAELDGDVELPSYMLYPIVPDGVFMPLLGTGGAFKTAYSTGMAVCLASGHHFFGMKAPQPVQVAIVTAEDNLRDYRLNVKAWKEAYPELDTGLIASNLAVLDLTKLGVKLVSSGPRGYSMNAIVVDRISEEIQRRLPACRLVIFETFHRLCPDETGDAIHYFIEACETISRRCNNATTMPVHHTGKGEGRSGMYAGRGHSSLEDDGRSGLLLMHGEGKDAVGAMKKVLGRDPTDDEKLYVTIVKHTKPYRCRPMPMMALTTKVSKWGVALAPYNAAATHHAKPPHAEDNQARELLEAVKDVMAFAGKSEKITPNRISAYCDKPAFKHAKITPRNIKAVFDKAVAMGLLAVDDTVKVQRGGVAYKLGPNAHPPSDAVEGGSPVTPDGDSHF